MTNTDYGYTTNGYKLKNGIELSVQEMNEVYNAFRFLEEYECALNNYLVTEEQARSIANEIIQLEDDELDGDELGFLYERAFENLGIEMKIKN